MELKVIREQYAASPSTGSGLGFTQGRLYIDDVPFCDTLEPAKDLKQHPCIPCGRYKVVMRYSPHCKGNRPWVQHVPGRQYILIHEGNTAKDSLGCILVGEAVKDGYIAQSRKILNNLMQKLNTAYTNKEKVWITIE